MSAPILSAFDWQVHGAGGERHLRAGFLEAPNTGKLQFRFKDALNVVRWIDLLTGLDSVLFNFAAWFNDATEQSLLLFVNGDSGIWEWDGAIATFASSSNTYGAIATIGIPNSVPNELFTGGQGYAVGEVLRITTGNNDALIGITSVVNNKATGIFAISNPGSGYVAGQQITFPAVGVDGTIDTVDGLGAVTSLHVTYPGQDVVPSSSYGAVGGSGTNLQVQFTVSGPNSVKGITILENGSGYTVSNNNPTTPVAGSGTGALADILSLYNSAIIIQGDVELGPLNFYTDDSTGTPYININGVIFSYATISGKAFVGVSPDPTGFSFLPGDLIFQLPRFTENKNMIGIPFGLKNQLIATLYQHVFIGSLTTNQLFFSNFDDYKDFSTHPGTPKPAGTGGLITLDSAAVALIAQEGDLYASAGLSEWYQIIFTQGQDAFGTPTELVNVQRLETAANQGTQSQALTGKISNNVMFVSNEKIAMTLGRVDNVVLTPQLTDFSYSIVNDMNEYDFSDGCIFYHKKFIYIAIPKESTVRIYNMTNEGKKGSFYWEAPQIMPISRFSIIDGDLYGHSYLVSETYKLFTGYNDNGHPYRAIALFSYQQDGVRSASKSFNEFYSEGYISANTVLTNGFNFDMDGFQTVTTFEINGNDDQVVGITPSVASLGKSSLGKNPLGGDPVVVGPNDLPPKFRVIKTFPRIPYYEYQPFYESDGMDQIWYIIAFGAATTPTTEDNAPITE